MKANDMLEHASERAVALAESVIEYYGIGARAAMEENNEQVWRVVAEARHVLREGKAKSAVRIKLNLIDLVIAAHARVRSMEDGADKDDEARAASVWAGRAHEVTRMVERVMSL